MIVRIFFFFPIAATLRVQSARLMSLSSPVPLCCRIVWCVTGLPLATHLVLLSAEVGISAVYVRPNIENVTEHRQLGLIVDNKFRWQAQIEHICKSMSKKLFFSLSTAACHQHRYQKILLQRSHKTSHRLCISSVGGMW